MFFNRVAEQSLVGHCLLDIANLSVAQSLYGDGKHFTLETQKMLQAIYAIADAGESITPTTMAVVTNTDLATWNLCLSHARSTELPTVITALSQAVYVKESRELAKLIAAPETSYVDTLALASQMGELAPPTKMDFGLSRVLEEIDHVDMPQFNTHLTSLHDVIGGFIEGTVINIGGRPAMGKTTLALDIAYELAKQGRRVFIQSYEMTARQVVERKLVSYMMGIKQNELDGWRRNPVLAHRVRQAMEQLVAMDNLMISDLGRPFEQTVGDWDQADPEFVVLDYLQLITSGGRYENQNVMYEGITSKIQGFAKGHNKRRKLTTMIVCCQLNREVERRDDKRPILSDLRGSGGNEQNCSYVLFPFLPHYYDPEANPLLGELILAKNRYGNVATVPVRCSDTGHFQ